MWINNVFSRKIHRYTFRLLPIAYMFLLTFISVNTKESVDSLNPFDI